MNSRRTEVGRKNQTLFCIARAKSSEFKTAEIEQMVKDTFSTGATTLNISQVLSGFAGKGNPILERTAKDDAWRFVSPKLKVVLRLALVLAQDGRVDKADYMEKLL